MWEQEINTAMELSERSIMAENGNINKASNAIGGTRYLVLLEDFHG